MTSDANSGGSKQAQDIILDTCILRYAVSKSEMAEQLVAYLGALVTKGFNLAISNISIFELLSGTTVKQEKDGLQTLSIFKKYNISREVLVGSSQLSSLYKKEKIPDSQISVADKIIGTTGFLTGSLILTADVNDFPRPFFSTVDERRIFFKKKNRSKMLVLQLFTPNYVVIRQRFNERPRG